VSEDLSTVSPDKIFYLVLNSIIYHTQHAVLYSYIYREELD